MATDGNAAVPDTAMPSRALATLYTGPLADAQPPLVGPCPESAVPGTALLDPERLKFLLKRFAATQEGRDPRGIASQWSKWHFGTVLLPALAANLLLDRDLPLALDRIHLLHSPEGQIRRLVLGNEGERLVDDSPDSRFSTLLEHHLLPLFEALAAISGASPRVFASNAGNVFEYCVSLLERHPAARPGMIKPARALMARHALANGRRNPLYRPVYYLSGEGAEPMRVRRLCCIRYLLSGLPYCGNCPLAVHFDRSDRNVANDSHLP